MKRIVQRHLTTSEAKEYLSTITRFSLLRYDPETKKPAGLKWIKSTDAIEALRASIQFETAIKAYPTALLTQRVFIGTNEKARKYFFLYLLDKSNDGLVLCSDGYFVIKKEFVKTIESQYAASNYASSTDCVAYHGVDDPYYKIPDTSEGQPDFIAQAPDQPLRIIFLPPDDPFARYLEEHFPGEFIIQPLTPIHRPLDLVVQNLVMHTDDGANPAQQILFGFHGSAGTFGLNSVDRNLGADVYVGPRATNIDAETLGNRLRRFLSPTATVTILSCATAGNEVEADGTTVRGLDTLDLICFGIGLSTISVVAADAVVTLGNVIGAATPGNVYRVRSDPDTMGYTEEVVQRGGQQAAFPLNYEWNS